MSPEHIHLTDSELSLEVPAEAEHEQEREQDHEADEIDDAAEQENAPPRAADDDMPLAALYAEPAEEAGPEPVGTGGEPDPKVDAKVRAALALLVRYEALGKDEARTIYRGFRG